MKFKLKLQPFKIDHILACILIPIIGFGACMIFSASSYDGLTMYKNINYFLTKQLINIILGLIVFYIVVRIPYQELGKKIKYIYFGGLFIQFLVFIPSLNRTVNGAARWVSIAGFTFQPSEIAKLTLIITLAYYIAKIGAKGVNHIKGGLLFLLMVIGIYVVVVLLQKHLSGAMILAGISFVMLWVGGLSKKYIVTLCAVVLGFAVLGVAIQPYRMMRVFGFLNPEADPLGKGYHIIQSWYALGSGQWFGLGLGMSRQKFSWLPESSTDFIMGIIGEELGFIGVSGVIIAYILFMFRGLTIAMKAPDHFGRLLVIGVVSMIFFQVFINIAVDSGLFPVTGMDLPFISYGGSSTIILFAAVGLIFNVASQTKLEEESGE